MGSRPPEPSDPVRRVRREFWGRAGLLLFGFLLAGLLVELGLRAAASWVGPRAIPAPGARETILTLGDSHTYGVYVPAESSYPGRLAALLEAREPGGHRVVNLGLPGTNSSEIATRLPGWLDAFAPQQVVLCAGVNNGWNRSDAERAGRRAPPVVRAVEGLRSLRLLRLLRHRVGPSEPPARPDVERRVIGSDDVVVEFRDRESGELLIRHEGNFLDKRPQAESLALLRRDLERIQAQVEARGARLVLLTYAEHPPEGAMNDAQRNHFLVNQTLRGFAAERGLVLVDPAPRIRERLARGGALADYFHPDASHPAPAGYALIADAVAEALETAPPPR